MNAKEQFSFIESEYGPELLEPDGENLSAILTCLGVKADDLTKAIIMGRQNPFAQKRGGLGTGAFSIVWLPGEQRAEFCNINVFGVNAELSPLDLEITDVGEGNFRLLFNGEEITTGNLAKYPDWGVERLQDGRMVIELIQAHGPRNLVTVIGSARCKLFDQGNSCDFCTLKGGPENRSRSSSDIIEALSFALADERNNYRLTLTTGYDSSVFTAIENAMVVKAIKSAYPDLPIALEVLPGDKRAIDEYFEAGVDTLMIPLDCASTEAQRRFVSGKMQALDNYWELVEYAVSKFRPGNVTSNIIVGLEERILTMRAITRMLEVGVVPEPIPVRWYAENVADGGKRPVTNPADLVRVRKYIEKEVTRLEFDKIACKVKAGCAACGGCGGWSLNKR